MWECIFEHHKPKSFQGPLKGPGPRPQNAHFARATPLCYVGNFRPQKLGPPLTKSWIRTWLYLILIIRSLHHILKLWASSLQSTINDTISWCSNFEKWKLRDDGLFFHSVTFNFSKWSLLERVHPFTLLNVGKKKKNNNPRDLGIKTAISKYRILK